MATSVNLHENRSVDFSSTRRRARVKPCSIATHRHCHREGAARVLQQCGIVTQWTEIVKQTSIDRTVRMRECAALMLRKQRFCSGLSRSEPTGRQDRHANVSNL